MSATIVLDTSVLGLLVHPHAKGEVVAATQWMGKHLALGAEIAIPEICDYELRRELHRIGSSSLPRLDELEGVLTYLPLTTAALRRAAELWARMRTQGIQTADDKALDGDVILCAQAQLHSDQTRRPIVIATMNVSHLSRMAIAKRWLEI